MFPEYKDLDQSTSPCYLKIIEIIVSTRNNVLFSQWEIAIYINADLSNIMISLAKV
jgi:hypothetical protein